MKTGTEIVSESARDAQVEANVHWLILLCIPPIGTGMIENEYFSACPCCEELLHGKIKHIFLICSRWNNQSSFIFDDLIIDPKISMTMTSLEDSSDESFTYIGFYVPKSL